MPIISRSHAATLACMLEVTAPKPGNVHRGADFHDMSLNDFLVSAVAIGPAFDHAAEQGVGHTLWQAIQATRAWTSQNTNLGILLLLAPLAAVPDDVPLRAGVSHVLKQLSHADALAVYRSIRLVQPGGLNPVDQAVERGDVNQTIAHDLLGAMRLAADRDLVARQYANGFAEVFECVVPWLMDDANRFALPERIVRTAVRLMSRFPDSLIQRKAGLAVAEEAATRAQVALQSANVDADAYHRALADLDFWLRADGHRRNPGTTADLIAAGLFVALREQRLRPPFG